MLRLLKLLWWTLAWIVALICAAWAFGALHFDFPIAGSRQVAACAFVVVVVAAIVLVRGGSRKLLAVFAAFALVLIWWRTLQPRNDRTWQADVAQTAWAEVDGDNVTLHNVRNCEYRTETDYTPHWETRTVNLAQISGLDLALNYWGSPYMAHPITSFQFGDAPPVCFSIETRKEVGESYSAIGGLYRQYELIYVCADERDVIRVRSNYRKAEDLYLYHTMATPAQARTRFLEYVQSINKLHDRPRWYNAITTNCTTSIRSQHATDQRMPWDWRLLVNGKGDELLYERGLLASGGLPFAELKQRSLINKAAQAANSDPDFSRLIRTALPQR